MKVLYIFDKYLNRTMNWAHRMIKYTPDIEPVIAAPLIVNNEFFEEEWEYIFSPYQWQRVEDEWSFSKWQTRLAAAAAKIPFLYKRALYKRFKNHKPELIQTCFGTVGANYLDLSEKLNVPLIVYFLGYDFENAPLVRPAYREKYRRLFASNAYFLVGGNDCKKKLIEVGASPERIYLVKLAIEPQSIQFVPTHKEKNRLNLLQACSFKAKKGHFYTIRAFKKALETCPNMHLTFAGEFVEHKISDEIQNYIKTHKLEEKVTIVPLFSYPKLLNSLYKTDVFIHPSITSDDLDRETAPVVMQDAHATGTPIISTYHADIPEQVIDKKSALLSPERDILSLSLNIERFYRMENEEYQRFALAGRKHIEENYDIRQSGKKMKEVYEEILKQENISS